MHPRAALLVVVPALGLPLAACGDDASTTTSAGVGTGATSTTAAPATTTQGSAPTSATPTPGTTTTTPPTTTTAGDGAATEERYAARAEAACQEVLDAAADARRAATALGGGPTPARLRRFTDGYAAYFVRSSRAISVLAVEDAPPSYDAFRAGTRRQADQIGPLFRRLACRARAADDAADLRALVATLDRAQRRLPAVASPPPRFSRLAPSCAKVAAQSPGR
jgi:hypothetical protein